MQCISLSKGKRSSPSAWPCGGWHREAIGDGPVDEDIAAATLPLQEVVAAAAAARDLVDVLDGDPDLGAQAHDGVELRPALEHGYPDAPRPVVQTVQAAALVAVVAGQVEHLVPSGGVAARRAGGRPTH